MAWHGSVAAAVGTPWLPVWLPSWNRTWIRWSEASIYVTRCWTAAGHSTKQNIALTWRNKLASWRARVGGWPDRDAAPGVL